jgi:hypothetical protein
MSQNWWLKKNQKKKRTLAPISNNLIIGHIYPHRERRRGEERGMESPKPYNNKRAFP